VYPAFFVGWHGKVGESWGLEWEWGRGEGVELKRWVMMLGWRACETVLVLATEALLVHFKIECFTRPPTTRKTGESPFKLRNRDQTKRRQRDFEAFRHTGLSFQRCI